MKAVYIKEPGKLEVIDVEKPSIKKDTQVLVKITAAGICGSDIHIFHGTHAYATYPRIIGHGVWHCRRSWICRNRSQAG